MLAHTYYDEDPRVRREAEALVTAGREVDVFALRRPDDAAEAVVQGVNVHRLGVQRHQGAPIGVYLGEYLDFFVRAAAALAGAQRARRYALVQVHTIPDFLVFAASPLKLLGVPVVLDFHEAMPEFFRSRFAGLAGPLTSRLVELQELASAGMADAVIAANVAVADRLVAAGVRADKVSVVHNSPNPALFDPKSYPRRAFAADGVFRLVYAGALTPNSELDVLLAALHRLRSDRPGQPCHLDVYGRGDGEDGLRAQAVSLRLDEVVTFHGRVPLESMAEAIAAADVGVSPVARNTQTDLSLPTKILEYARMGKPIVASDLATVLRYFPDGELATYRAGDVADLAAVLTGLLDEPKAAARRVKRAAARVAELSWERESVAYLMLIERLATRE